MLYQAARKALGELFDPALRQVLWKSVGLTIAGLIAIWFAVRWLVEWAALPYLTAFVSPLALPEWTGLVGVFAAITAGIVLAIALAFLIGPVSAIIAGVFLDDVAEHVERQDYPADAPGTPVPLGRSVVLSVKFFGVVVAGNLAALLLLLVPGINLVAFLVVNAYLLGREYFQFAAMRFHDEATVHRLRSQYSATVIMAGLLIAGFMAIPIVNLMTPLFGAALMVHLHKAIAARDAASAPGSAPA
ncbi:MULTISPECIES: sulfate transporter family protein [unclassified Roseitalea]|uniref:sulfate transporter family protein n=1 Tax=unclassified Roseitalea TaxID=2639107 RepID=UPI00273D1749|nr:MULTISPECIES: sulfate transporter family protein [unclassified Roseitalea]